jgi:integrase
MNVEYKEYLKTGGKAIWLIDNIPVILTVKRASLAELQNQIDLLERKIASNDSLKEVTDVIGFSNLLNIIESVFLEEFLSNLKDAQYSSFKSCGKFDLNQYLITELGASKTQKTFPLALSKKKHILLCDKIFDTVLIETNTPMNLDMRLENDEDLCEICASVGLNTLLRYCFKYRSSSFSSYVKRQARICTDNRESIYYFGMMKKIFGYMSFITDDVKAELELFRNIVDEEYAYQCKYLIETNNQAVDVSKDCWNCFFIHGITLNSFKYDFSEIKSPTLKKEIKIYYRNLLVESMFKKFDISEIPNITKVLNFLSFNNSKIHFFADIDATDANSVVIFLNNEVISQFNKNLAPATVKGIISLLSDVNRFLMERPIETANTPIPYYNFFNDLTFYNLNNMCKNTDVIPDEIMEQLEKHIKELKPMYQIMFRIFNETGLRLKEVIMLEIDCVNTSSNEFRYVPYKVLNARRKHSLPDKRIIYISDEVKECIFQQINETTAARTETNTSYLFLVSNKGYKTVLTGGGFKQAMNTLIEKYDIRDIDGHLWKFQVRQTRKTVAATMIMNGASETEVMQQLGHLSSDTTRRYYEEVEKKKLSDLNSKFFKEQFEVKIGKDRLKLFSESERKALYVDFKLAYRELEFGQCMKHESEGPCATRTGKINCANCSKLCTGKKYIEKWTHLLESQKAIILDLENSYTQDAISEDQYKEFIQYKRETYLLNSYQAVVNNILKDA